MSHPLPGAWSLIKDSWIQFTKTWSTTMRYSAWFVLAGVHTLIFLFLLPKGANGVTAWIFALSLLVVAIILVWATIMLYQAVFALEGGHAVTPKTTEDAPRLILPLIWVGILENLVIFAAMLIPIVVAVVMMATRWNDAMTPETLLGGLLPLLWVFIPFVLVTIYLSVRLCFAQLALIGANKRGRAALVDSWKLTDDRFWSIFGRQLAAGIVFGLVMIVALWIVVFIVELIAGPAVTRSLATGGNNIAAGDAISSILSSFVQAALTPVVIIFQVKLYRALEKTR